MYIGMDMLVCDKRGDRTSCLAREVLVSFDMQKQVGWSYRIRAAGKPPNLVGEFGSASTAKGDAGDKRERHQGGACRHSGCTTPAGVTTRACKAPGWRKGVPGGYHRSVATAACLR